MTWKKNKEKFVGNNCYHEVYRKIILGKLIPENFIRTSESLMGT